MRPIRPAALADLPALHALVERAYRGEEAKKGWTHEADMLGGQRTDPGELTRILTDPSRVILAAEADGRIIGCVQLIDEGDGVAYLGMLSVEPSLQNTGLGKRLMAAADANARDRFCAHAMRMTVISQRTVLIDWYERLG